MKSLREAVKAVHRCIIICRHGLWACTDREGAEYSDLKWYDSLESALFEFNVRLPTVKLDAWESKTATARQRWTKRRSTTWVAEWWDGAWHRPFGKLKGQVYL